MKAGSTGSNPGGGTTVKNATSAALQKLLNGIGSASFYLNTIVVGLDAVEKGHEKPDTLVVSWEPKDRPAAARMARKFAVEAFIIRAAEELQAFIRDLSVLPRFQAMAAKWTKDTGAAERLDQVASDVLGKDEYLIASGMLLVTWRNKIVHDGKLSLPPHKKRLLQRNGAAIANDYRNLNVDLLMQHVRSARPTLKDVSSLIAMSINLAKAIDSKVYAKLTMEDVLAWVKYYSLDISIRKVLDETAPEKVSSSIERVFRTHAPRLYPDFIRFFDPLGTDFRQGG